MKARRCRPAILGRSLRATLGGPIESADGLIARKLDDREAIAAQFSQTPADQWRQQRTLKDIDRGVVAGLDQLLVTPKSRRRVGVEIADPDKPPSKMALLPALKNGEITPEEYNRQKTEEIAPVWGNTGLAGEEL